MPIFSFIFITLIKTTPNCIVPVAPSPALIYYKTMQRIPFPLPVCPPAYQQGSKTGQQRAFSAKLYRDFWRFSVDEASKLLEQKEPEYWERKGEQLALELFHAASSRIPSLPFIYT